MRIVGGIYKGQQLVSFDANHIRPTTDRVKESLFNILQVYLDENSVVADCFSGTGNLGIEALSRGAKFVYFIEQNPKSLAIIKRNIEKLRISDQCYKIIKQNVLDYFAKADLSQISICLIDPPFTQKMGHDTMVTLSQSKYLQSGLIAAIETSSNERIETQYENLIQIKQRTFGDKLLSIFELSHSVE